MRTIVINTGTEILLGDVLNTHLSFIAREILPLGLRIERQLTVPDGVAIHEALTESFASAEIVFITGGLGPTTDDITRELTSDLLGLELKSDPNVLRSIEERFARRGFKWTSRIARQAEVPAGAEVLPNENGTAPGLYFRENLNPQIRSPHLFVLPGPPRELRPMFTDYVLPLLQRLVPLHPDVEFRTYRIAGMGESLVEEAIGEKILEVHGIELGYCSRPGEVDLRMIGPSAAIARGAAIVESVLGSAIFSSRGEQIEEVLIRRLLERKETLALAESCTGGLLAHRITNVPGASGVFLAGYVTYANAAKIKSLGVDEGLIEEFGAVSESVARAMAEGARNQACATHALATTGIAGPDGGTPEKPVGTVYIAVASLAAKTIVRQFDFASDRETFKQLAAQTAFNMLRLRLP